jgi:DNA-binding transcriptional regulator YbjK
VISRRDLLTDAALRVVADDGLKGLTHRAVDRRAGLALGSTANVFARRTELLDGVIAELERRDLALWDAVGSGRAPRSVAELADLLATFVVAAVGPDLVDLTRARLSLSLSHPDRLRATHGRLVDALTAAMAGVGVGDPARRAPLVAALLDGQILHAVTVRGDRPDHSNHAALTTGLAALMA